MQGAMSNGGMSSPLNSVLRKTISPWYDDNPNPLAGASWPQYLKNAMVITPPRTHTTWASGLTSGTPIMLLPKNGGAVIMPATLMVGPASASASSPNIRIGYASNSSFEMTNGGSHVCYFGNAGGFGTRVGGAAQFTAHSGGYFGFASTGGGSSLGTAETCIFRPASATIGVYNPTSTTTAQTFELYNTWTSTTSFENLRFKSTAGAAYQIGSAKGSAGGTNRDISFGHFNSAGAFTSSLTVWTTGGAEVVGGFNVARTGGSGSGLAFNAARGVFAGAGLSAYDPEAYTSDGLDLGGRESANKFTIFTGRGAGTGNGGDIVFDFGRGISTGVNGKLILRTDSGSSAGVLSAVLQVEGDTVFTPGVRTTGSPTAFTLTGAAHTTLTASTEATDVNFNLARTVQFATGALATQRAMRIQAPTYSFVGASTITTASTLSISGPPVAGTNATITNKYALNVESGTLNINTTTWGQTLISLKDTSYSSHYASLSVTGNNNSALVLCAGHPSSPTMAVASVSNYTGRQGLHVAYGTFIGFSENSAYVWDNSNSGWFHKAEGVIAQRAQATPTTAQTYQITGTWTSTTSYELINIKGKASANFEIGPENGSAGGTLRGLTIGCYPAGTSTIVGWAQFRPNTSTGALEAFYLGPIADSTAVGGNARGTGAVDLQTSRSAASQVASGSSSLIVASQRATASGSGAVVFASVTGNSVVASGANSVAFAQGDSGGASGACAVAFGNFPGYGGAFAAGDNSLAACGGRTSSAATFGKAFGGGSYSDRYGQYTNANGYFANIGDAQQCGFVARRKTTDATPVNLMLDGSSTRLTIPSGKTMSGFLIVKGIKSDGSAKARFVRLCDITNVGGTTTLDTPIEAIGTDYNPSGCVLAVTAENATDDLQINIIGPAGETWRWTATFSGLEIAYGV